MSMNKILVVYDPTKEKQPALERAVGVAFERRASVHLFACIYSDLSKSVDGAAEQERLLASQLDELKAIQKSLKSITVPVSVEVEWDEDWYTAVVRAALRNEADAVFKSTYKHRQHKRILNRSSDWTLIRECHCPVLLIREDQKPRDVRKVLAAIDIRNEKEDYINLNQNVVEISKHVSADSKSEVHFINAYQDSLDFPDRSKLLEVCGVANDRIHVKHGKPENVIVENAKQLDVSVVVIGSSGRSGLSAVVKGNTAEKILDELDCDVLAIP